LINASPEPYLTNFFGTAKPVTANVGRIGNQYKSFFQAEAVMNLGQLVHDDFATAKPDAGYPKHAERRRLRIARRNAQE
jgi:hypothetical protein